MTDRPDVEWAAGRPVDRLEGPGRRPPRRRAVVVAVLVALVGGASVTRAVVSHQPDHPRAPAAAGGRPTPTGRPAPAQGAAADSADLTGGNEVVAAARISGRVRVGDTLRFVVVLQSSRLLLLHPCPAYTITVGTHTTRRQLSCDRVPYVVSLVRPDGTVSAFRPALPAGTSVAFRMHVRVPDGSGPRQVTWALLGARPASVSGTVTVTRGRS